METTAATAIKAVQESHHLRAAMNRLLYRLRNFVRAVPMLPDGDLPEHDIVWMSDIGRSGPEATIIDAIKMHPELWAKALPEGCCVVHREMLKKHVGPAAAEHLENYGSHIVANEAARLLYQDEERERQEQYSLACGMAQFD